MQRKGLLSPRLPYTAPTTPSRRPLRGILMLGDKGVCFGGSASFHHSCPLLGTEHQGKLITSHHHPAPQSGSSQTHVLPACLSQRNLIPAKGVGRGNGNFLFLSNFEFESQARYNLKFHSDSLCRTALSFRLLTC